MEQLTEILRRPFGLTATRLLLHLHQLTDGRGHGDVAVASIEQLAALCGSARPHVSAVVDELVAKMVIARDERASTWWLQPVEFWGVLPTKRVDEAHARICAVDDQRRAQIDAWPQPTAADLHEPPSEKLTVPPSEKLTAVRKTDGVSLPASARAPEPGNQIPDNQEVLRKGTGTGLDHRGWTILRELEAWCTEPGEACTRQQRANWGWRIWTQPLELLAAFEDAKRHVAQGKAHKSRFGLVKSFWRARVGDDTVLSPPPRSADRLHGGEAPAPPAGGVHTSGSVGPGGGAAQPPPAPSGALCVRPLPRRTSLGHPQEVFPDVTGGPPRITWYNRDKINLSPFRPTRAKLLCPRGFCHFSPQVVQSRGETP